MNDCNVHDKYKKLPYSIICQLPCRKPSPVKEFVSNFNPLTFSKIKVLFMAGSFRLLMNSEVPDY